MDSDQLEHVFLRLGHAETDEQLQNVISKFLPPVLLKLSSTQEGVRKKVMELLVHMNKHIRSCPIIQLPVETLLVQYQDPAAVSFVTVTDELATGDALVDLLLANKEQLVDDVKAKGSLGCSDHGMVEFKILRGVSKTKIFTGKACLQASQAPDPTSRGCESEAAPTVEEERVNNMASRRMKTPAKYMTGTAALPFNPATFGEIVLYLRMCLAHSAGVVPTLQSLADMQDHAPAIGRYIRNLMSGNHVSSSSFSSSSKSVETNPVQIYIGLLQQLLSGVGALAESGTFS
nr:PREDICTED: proteasome-associated protein ECM29 homolog [Apteryx mantelli mantelli]